MRKEKIKNFFKRHILLAIIISLIFYHLFYHLVILNLIRGFFYGLALVETDYWEYPVKRLDYFLKTDYFNSIFLVLKLPPKDINEIIKHAKRPVQDVYYGNELYNYMIVYNDGTIVFCTDRKEEKDSKGHEPFPICVSPFWGGKIEGVTKFYECKHLRLKKEKKSIKEKIR